MKYFKMKKRFRASVINNSQRSIKEGKFWGLEIEYLNQG